MHLLPVATTFPGHKFFEAGLVHTDRTVPLSSCGAVHVGYLHESNQALVSPKIEERAVRKNKSSFPQKRELLHRYDIS